MPAALDAFKATLKEAHAIYESMEGLVNSQPGFDANGNVTNPARAQATVKAMHGKKNRIREAIRGTGEALRVAIRSFREADFHPQPTPTR